MAESIYEEVERLRAGHTPKRVRKTREQRRRDRALRRLSLAVVHAKGAGATETHVAGAVSLGLNLSRTVGTR